MKLTNYWWLLIWLFVGGILLGSMPKRQERLDGRTVARWGYLPALLLVLPYMIWTGYRVGFGDTEVYRKAYLDLSVDFAQGVALMFSKTKDPGFNLLSMALKFFIGNRDELFFLVIAAFQMVSIALVYRRFSRDYWLCIFLFVVSTDYMSWMHNGMRQFIAVCMIFACFGWLLKKKYLRLILVILAAAQIHGSALLMIPIIFIVQGKAWNIKTIAMLAATVVGILFLDQFTPILNDILQDTQYDDIMTNEIWSTDNGTNIIRVLVYSAPALLSLAGRKYVQAANRPIINICVNCAIMTMALYAVAAVTSGIYIGRLPIYTTLQGYMAVPWLIDHMFDERSAKLVKYLMCGAFLAFFYYQMRITWNLL